MAREIFCLDYPVVWIDCRYMSTHNVKYLAWTGFPVQSATIETFNQGWLAMEEYFVARKIFVFEIAFSVLTSVKM
jgi:hypothetical protein